MVVVAVITVVVVEMETTVVMVVFVVAMGMVALVEVVVVRVGAMTEVKFVMPEALTGLSCWAAFDCLAMAGLDCARVLQAWMPSYHV